MMRRSEVSADPQLSTGRLFMLGISSLILCISFFMAIFAPLPIALAVVLYGRVKGYGVGLLCLGLALPLLEMFFADGTLSYYYVFVLIIAAIVAEIVLRNIPPVKGVIVSGLVLLSLIAGAVGLVVWQQPGGLKQILVTELESKMETLELQKEQIEQRGGENSHELLALLSQPELLADMVIRNMPSYIFMSVFFLLWANTFLVLKSRRILFSSSYMQYTEDQLLQYRVPAWVLAILIPAMVCAVWGEDLYAKWLADVGLNVTKALGLFYFFQGFGILIDFFNYLKMFGLFRTLLVVFIVITAPWFIAAVGLFDYWFEFRNKMKKKPSE